jgi:hypothetical protein
MPLTLATLFVLARIHFAYASSMAGREIWLSRRLKSPRFLPVRIAVRAMDKLNHTSSLEELLPDPRLMAGIPVN